MAHLKPPTEFQKNLPWSLAWNPSTRGAWTFLYHRALGLGWIWPFIYSIGAIFFTVFDGWDPLNWRSFSSSDPLMQYMHATNGSWASYSNHHFLNLVLVAALCFGLAYYFTEHSEATTSFIRRYYSFGLLATFGSIWVWAVHEGMWWIIYIIFSPMFYHWTIVPKEFFGTGELFCFGLICMTAALSLYFPWKYVALMAAFYAAWIAVGFPITESYIGNTVWYGTLWGNGWEVGSWAWAVGAFYLTEKDRLLAWSLKVHEAILQRPNVGIPAQT